MNKLQVHIFWVLMLIGMSSSKTLSQSNVFQSAMHVHQGDTMEYKILWPVAFDKNKKYPVVLFLHGAGERGHDNNKQLIHGSKLFEYTRAEYPAIVIFPQCPQNDYWSNVDVEYVNIQRRFNFRDGGEPTQAMRLILNMMDSIFHQTFTDTKRMYVGGLSMGGMGTFELVNRRPKMFVAAFPICGGGNPSSVKNYVKEVSFWVFHGAKDEIVDIKHSEKMVDEIKRLKGEVKFSLYSEANHNSWDSAFAEPGLLKWLFAQQKD